MGIRYRTSDSSSIAALRFVNTEEGIKAMRFFLGEASSQCVIEDGSISINSFIGKTKGIVGDYVVRFGSGLYVVMPSYVFLKDFEKKEAK